MKTQGEKLLPALLKSTTPLKVSPKVPTPICDVLAKSNLIWLSKRWIWSPAIWNPPTLKFWSVCINVVLIPIVSRNASPTTFNLPVGFVVPKPTAPKTAVACWKSTSANVGDWVGIATVN